LPCFFSAPVRCEPINPEAPVTPIRIDYDLTNRSLGGFIKFKK
jgi:hypothetical protein